MPQSKASKIGATLCRIIIVLRPHPRHVTMWNIKSRRRTVPEQMALIHNCLAAGQVGLEPINLIKLIRYVVAGTCVWVCAFPLQGLERKSKDTAASMAGNSRKIHIHPCGFCYLLASLLSFVNISLHLFHRTQLQSGWMDLPFDVASRTRCPRSHPLEFIRVCALALICSQTNLFYNWIWNWRWHSVSDCLACGSSAAGHSAGHASRVLCPDDPTSAVYVFGF